jgi:ribosomal protein S18 acetylase RimI-like enzyme
LSISVHDNLPEAEAHIVDIGLGEANDAAAQLHEVRPLSCFARDETGQVVGGAIGRWWGQCCELQQLWVKPEARHRGTGSCLVRAFEGRAREYGCLSFYLETFSFQAPGFYQALGYEVAYEHKVYPHGIVRYLMVKRERNSPSAA